MKFFFRSKVKYGFHEKLNDDGKIVLFISNVAIKKSFQASQKLPFQQTSLPGI